MQLYMCISIYGKAQLVACYYHGTLTKITPGTIYFFMAKSEIMSKGISLMPPLANSTLKQSYNEQMLFVFVLSLSTKLFISF